MAESINMTNSSSMNLGNVPTDIDDIIFSGRNKAYGAYFLRKRYGKNILIASIIGIGLTVVVVAGGIISSMLSDKLERDKKFKMNEVELLPPPPIDPNVPPPPPPPEIPPPPKVAMIKFLPPEIKPDKEVQQEELPPPIEDVKDKQISAITQEGNTTNEIIVEPGNDKGVVAEPEKDQIFTAVEIQAAFPGGFDALSKFLGKNIKYPKAAQRANVKGKVFLSFVVNSQGKISDIKVLKGVGFGCDEEAIRVVQSMPSWTPGKQGGRSVSSRFTLPISFTLASE